MALTTDLTKREREMVLLIAEAYEAGAADNVDIFLYVNQYMGDVTFREVDEFTTKHLGPFNMTVGAPRGYKLH